MLPLSFFIDGKEVLVVGGGKIATRKVRNLLAADGCVKVVSPDISADLQGLVASGCVNWEERRFKAADVSGMLLAFAATDDPAVNRQVLNACHEAGVICSSVDHAWPDGDFLTPATYRQDGLVVSVTSGGQSCRRSRTIRDALARHVQALGNANLFILGISHDQLAVKDLESYFLSESARQDLGEMLNRILGIHEFLILQTCNRLEVWGVGVLDAPARSLLLALLKFDRLERTQYYIKQGFDAFVHTALVVSGFLSQSLGENQIVSQVKKALINADEACWARGIVKEWVSHSLHISKAIRTATSDFVIQDETEDACIRYLDGVGVLGGDDGLLLVGSGMLGKSIAEKLIGLNIPFHWCYHSKHPELDGEQGDGVTLLPFDALAECFEKVQTIICATSADEYIIRKDHASFFSSDKHLLIVDLAVPRNVDPLIVDVLPDVALVDIGGLKSDNKKDAVDAQKAVAVAGKIVEDRKGLYEEIVNSLKNGRAQ